MAGYVLWHGKKRQLLARREQEFQAILQAETNTEKLKEWAEEIRAAQIRALKSKRAQLPPSEKNLEKVNELEREMEIWLHSPADSIIEIYKMKLKKNAKP